MKVASAPERCKDSERCDNSWKDGNCSGLEGKSGVITVFIGGGRSGIKLSSERTSKLENDS